MSDEAKRRVREQLGWTIEDYRRTSFGGWGKVIYPSRPECPVITPTELEIAAFNLAVSTTERVIELEKALDNIANPIAAMRVEAEAQGAKLDGRMAVELANDASYLQSVARAALGEGKVKA